MLDQVNDSYIPVYTIQPVVKPVEQPVGRTVENLFEYSYFYASVIRHSTSHPVSVV